MNLAESEYYFEIRIRPNPSPKRRIRLNPKPNFGFGRSLALIFLQMSFNDKWELVVLDYVKLQFTICERLKKKSKTNRFKTEVETRIKLMFFYIVFC